MAMMNLAGDQKDYATASHGFVHRVKKSAPQRRREWQRKREEGPESLFLWFFKRGLVLFFLNNISRFFIFHISLSYCVILS